jgi:hypothetical protein
MQHLHGDWSSNIVIEFCHSNNDMDDGSIVSQCTIENTWHMYVDYNYLSITKI